MLESIDKLYMENGDWVAAALAFHQKQLRERIDLLENHPGRVDLVAGGFSIADIALFPMLSMLEDFIDIPLSHYPHIARWLQRLSERAAFRQASNVER